MAILENSLKLLPKNTTTEYMGISRVYFPKWEGWWYIDSSIEVPNSVVQEFYNKYFWSKLGGNTIQSQDIANLLFIFSVLAGKKKAMSKLRRVLNLDNTLDSDTITILNQRTDVDYIFLYLYAEMVELLIINKVSTYSILSCYYSWLSKSSALAS